MCLVALSVEDIDIYLFGTMITGILLIGLGFALGYRRIQKTGTAVQSPTRLPVCLQKLVCLLAPKTKQSYLFLAPLQWPWQGCCWNLPWDCNAVRHSCVPPPPYRHYRHYRHCPPTPPRPFASVRFDPLAWSSGSDQRRISGCGIRWLLAGPDSLPHVVCLWCMCFCVAEVFFLFSHCTPQGA